MICTLVRLYLRAEACSLSKCVWIRLIEIFRVLKEDNLTLTQLSSLIARVLAFRGDSELHNCEKITLECNMPESEILNRIQSSMPVIAFEPWCIFMNAINFRGPQNGF